MKQLTYNAALYLRISREDSDRKDESVSITNQRAITEKWCRENGVNVVDCYVDEDYSGTNFNRPAFQRMINDIEDGKINCVITKDTSRLGRNYIESGIYLEEYFPKHGVRYIAIGDGVDSLNRTSMDIAPFRNLLNEMYAKDISNKIKSALKSRQEQGKFVGAKAPYGYRKDPNDHNHLIVDEETAPVVRRIYDEIIGGKGIVLISRELESEGIPAPSGGDEWAFTTIQSILKNPVYGGNIVICRRPTTSFKVKKRQNNSWNGIGIVENTHEAIISPEKQELALKILQSRRRVGDNHKVHNNVFKGLLKCADCGKSLTLMVERNSNAFYCLTYRKKGKDKCSSHRIKEDVLYNAVLAEIRKLAKSASEDKDFKTSLLGAIDGAKQSEKKQSEKELRKAEKRLSEVNTLFQKLFEAFASGKVNDSSYQIMRAKYELERTDLEARIEILNENVHRANENAHNATQFAELIKQYTNVETLDTELLNALVDRIAIHKKNKTDNTQQIEIYYKFIGKI